MFPKVSIILPIYNVEKYLDKCLDTLVNQTLKEIEIICVIDKSPDNSIDICKKWAAEDNRIVIIDKPINEGLGLTRNAGLEVATGEYVAFVDSDDYVDVEMYENLYSFAKEYKLDASFCNYARDTNGSISSSNEPTKELFFDNHFKTTQFMLDMVGPEPSYPHDVKYLVSVWRSIYLNKIIKEYHIKFESERNVVSEDIFWNIDFLMHTNRSGYIPFVGYYYRYNTVSLSRTYNHEKANKMLDMLCLIREKLNSYFPNDCSAYLLNYQRMVFYIFRNLIKYESVVNIENNRQKHIKALLENSLIHDVMSEYPISKMTIDRRFFSFCMKKKLVRLLITISLLDNYRHRFI